MSGLLEITLGILTSMGGFVDISELVFNVQAGVKFGFALAWAVAIGTIGIMTFSELSGRIAAVTKQANFDTVKRQLPVSLSVAALIASVALSTLTCAAELGGMAIALQLLTGLANLPATILTVGILITTVWLLPFKYLEKSFGLLGLLMLVFVAGMFASQVNIGQLAMGFIPRLPPGDTKELLVYAYFAMGIISSSMMPYEIYFYSSGGIEEGWTPKNILDNRLTSVIGMSFGSIVALALLVMGHQVLASHGITPQLHGTAAILAST